jgi:hypothetical protein
MIVPGHKHHENPVNKPGASLEPGVKVVRTPVPQLSKGVGLATFSPHWPYAAVQSSNFRGGLVTNSA